MCNLYNLTSNQQAIRDFIDITRYHESNLPPSINVHPDRPGLIIRVERDGERQLAMLNWGMPTPAEHLDGKPDKGVTNVRKTRLPHVSNGRVLRTVAGSRQRPFRNLSRCPTPKRERNR